jgi:hypothetical protein
MFRGSVHERRNVTAEGTRQYLNPQGELSVRNRLIVTGTAAAFVLTAGIVGAVAVQPPGQEQDRETSAAPASDALQGLPPMMLKREPASAPENGTVDVRSKPGPQQNPFTYTPAPKQEYIPRHMADPRPSQPDTEFTMAPLPGIDFGQGTGPSSPTKPSVTPPPRPSEPPTQSPRPTPTPTPTPTPSPDPTPTPTPTPSPDPTPTPTPTPTPEPTDPPSEEPTDPPTEEPTDPPAEEPTTEPTPEPTPEPTEEPTTEPSPDPSTEPSPEPSPSNPEGSTE